MKRKYNKNVNVFDASVDRLDYIFNTFEKVYISFSGGKDSGVLINLVADYIRKNGIKKKVGIQIMDNEANYDLSLEFMHRVLKANLDIFDVYWCCLPITLPCTVSAYDLDWQCWGVNDKDRWIRPLPEESYVVSWENYKDKGFDFFEENMAYDHFWDEFAEWYADGKLTANLIGIRTQESLNRFRAILNERKETIGGNMWTKKNTKNVFNCYPIFDWRTDDIWLSNAKFGWDYNHLYDVFYRAGVPVGSMRVASPFMSEAKASLNLYRVIDPHIWARLCARVNGANFMVTYGKQLNYKNIKLPAGHTWKTFTKFLLDTLPKEAQENFKKRFIQSFKVWGRVGRGLPKKVIDDMRDNGVIFKTNGYTSHGRKDLERVVVKAFPDHVDFLSSHNGDVPSWKRFAVTILKNDHTCKYMGLSPTKEQALRQRQITAKYKTIGDKK